MTEVEFGRFGRATTDAPGPLGEGTVGCVVDERSEAAADRVALGPDDNFRSRIVKLFCSDTSSSVGSSDRIVGIVINPGGLVTALVAIVVGGNGTIVDGNDSPDDFRISLGTGRANLASGGVFSREFFGMLAVDEGGLFIAKPNVSAETWGIVAPRGITAQAACIQIHAAI